MASGTSTAASVLDSRTGRMRARVTLGVDWLVVNALAPVDPLARVLRGSPRTDVYAHYDRIRARGDLVPAPVRPAGPADGAVRAGGRGAGRTPTAPGHRRGGAACGGQPRPGGVRGRGTVPVGPVRRAGAP